MDELDVRLLERLPLAHCVLNLFDHVLDDGLCGELFEAFRGRCYEDRLAFSTLVRILRDALVLHGGSANRAIGRAVEANRLEAAPSGVYRKLGHLPPALSQALLLRGTRRLAPLMHAPARVLPACFDELDVIAIDGKKLKKAAKRLLAARAYSTGSLLGGKLLVALSVRAGLAVAMNADEDGERNDVPLVKGLLEQLKALRAERSFLFVADRQFADLNLPDLFTRDQNHFLLRCTKTLGFEADPQRAAQEGVDEQGRPFTWQWGWIGSARDPRRRYVRRITLTRPDEKDDLILITDLLDEAAFPAAQLLALYRLRWNIEEMFQQVTEVFALARLIGSSPRGIIFQGALCLLIYNLTLAIKSHIAQAGKKEMEEVSTENLFYDVKREMIAWSVLSDPANLPPPAPRDAAEMKQHLNQRMRGLWHARWLKKKDKRPRKPRERKPLPGGHGSLWKIINGVNESKTRVSEDC